MIIHPEILRKFIAEALHKAGVSWPEAQVIAEILLDADLEGKPSHGISRLPVYVSCLKRGRMNSAPAIECRQIAPALGRVDGDNGLGLLVGARAMTFAMELADKSGAGFVAVKRSSHFGTAAYYCRMAAEAGKIGLALTNAPSGVSPWGGRSAFLGTNPIAMAFPGRDSRHVVVDLSTSVTARGRIIQAAKAGQPIPEGWAVDQDGRPTTDAKAAMQGAVLPMAGPKGYALGLAVEILCSVLTGAAFGPHVGWMYDGSLKPVDVGHAFLAIDVAPLMDVAVFTSRLEDLVKEIKEVPLAYGHQEIFIPGERGRLAAFKHRDGLDITEPVLGELEALAGELGLAPLSAMAEER